MKQQPPRIFSFIVVVNIGLIVFLSIVDALSAGTHPMGRGSGGAR